MELRHIRYFLVLSEELHFTRAADRCGVSQPCLSAAIRKMETELGGVLVHRRPQPQLSELGRAVHPLWDEALRKIDQSFQIARARAPAVATNVATVDVPTADVDAVTADAVTDDAMTADVVTADAVMADIPIAHVVMAAAEDVVPAEAAFEPAAEDSLAPVRLAMEELEAATTVPRAEPIPAYEPDEDNHYGEKSDAIVARLRDKLMVASCRARSASPAPNDDVFSLPSRLAPPVAPARPLYAFQNARPRRPLVAAVTAMITAPAARLFGRSRP